MKLEEKNLSKENQRNKFFPDIPKDSAMEAKPTMRAVVIANIEDIEEVESLSRNCP